MTRRHGTDEVGCEADRSPEPPRKGVEGTGRLRATRRWKSPQTALSAFPERVVRPRAVGRMVNRLQAAGWSETDPAARPVPISASAERALRGIALGRRSWLFAGSDRGGDRAAAMYSLIVTARLNSVDPRAWLADVLARIADHPASRLHELLPWNWRHAQDAAAAA
jgi:hypothetical protein